VIKLYAAAYVWFDWKLISGDPQMGTGCCRTWNWHSI